MVLVRGIFKLNSLGRSDKDDEMMSIQKKKHMTECK